MQFSYIIDLIYQNTLFLLYEIRLENIINGYYLSYFHLVYVNNPCVINYMHNINSDSCSRHIIHVLHINKKS